MSFYFEAFEKHHFSVSFVFLVFSFTGNCCLKFPDGRAKIENKID
jgi:hypothetical protein